jgi:hypothetical protein
MVDEKSTIFEMECIVKLKQLQQEITEEQRQIQALRKTIEMVKQHKEE